VEAPPRINPTSRIVWIPNAGHFAWIDEPDAVVREVERFPAE
jgi:pimeloyl-ACP methyl ester carboxylesterase